jgi:Arc/MetJ-type ribon-helix-helix transcriptional regulator
MSQETGVPEVVERTPIEAGAAADWNEALEHAIKAAREAFNASAVAASEVLRQGGKLVGRTVGDAQRTVCVTLDKEALETLDKMVSAGIQKSRADAVRYLLRRGLQASGDLLAKIDKVEQEIQGLREKMREIPLEGGDEQPVSP